MKRREHVYIRLDVIERYLADLARFHADAGRPAHVAGVRSALSKIRREVARSDIPGDNPGINHGARGALMVKLQREAPPLDTPEHPISWVRAPSATPFTALI